MLDYARCPLFYAFRHIYKVSPNVLSDFGICLEAAREYLKSILARYLLTGRVDKDWPANMAETLSRLEVSKEVYHDIVARCYVNIDKFLGRFTSGELQLIGVNSVETYRLNPWTIIVEADVVASINSKEIRIIDINDKVNPDSPVPALAAAGMKLYAKARGYRYEVFHPLTGSSILYEPAVEPAIIPMLVNICKAIKAKLIYPSPTSCNACDYQLACAPEFTHNRNLRHGTALRKNIERKLNATDLRRQE